MVPWKPIVSCGSRVVLAALLALALPAPTAAAVQDVRARWEALSQEEQRRLLENYERWKKLSRDDRDVMKRRFERLETERGRARELLDDDERGRFERMRDDDRRSELTRRAKAAVSERLEQLPPDLRRRIEHDLRGLPPAERERRVKELVKQHVERELRARLARKVESGELSRDAVEELRRQAAEREGDPRARLELLRRFILEHPDAFRLSPAERDRIRSTRDPGAALRLLDRLRQRRAPPRRDRTERDGAPPRDV